MDFSKLLHAAVASAVFAGVVVAAGPGKPDSTHTAPVAASQPASPPLLQPESVVAAVALAPVRSQHAPGDLKVYPSF
jgi:hypothetical protein